ncbi:MAG: response regulator [Lachnospiraceae bacterium]|nr:response regulator [Lachnospiraceae bacterium]
MENQQSNKKKNRTTHFLLGSFVMLLILGVSAFMYLSYYMSRVSEESIDKVGNVYMSGIKEHIVAHFRTLIDLKFEQVEAVVQVVPVEMDDMDELYEELIYRTNVRNFNYLALCAEDGTIEMLDGEQFELTDPDPFFESLKEGKKKVAVGRDANGNEIVIFGVDAHYPMKSGKTCTALAAAVPIEYISTMLGTDEEENAIIYSHIIRKDGSFIVSDMSDEYVDYFSALYEKYTSDDPAKIENYIDGLSRAMAEKKDYSAIMNFEGSSQQVYCTMLPYSEWHLLTILPFGVLNETVENMNRDRTAATLLIGTIVLAVLLIIFFVYFKMTRQQMKELEEAREEALEANKAKSTFLSNMSHDIRTPMNAIVGMTAIAMTHIEDREQVQNCLRKITLSGKHLLGLINDVLDMSKIESGKMTLTAERISLREVVEGVVGIVQSQIRGKSQNFNVHISNIIAEDVYCDSVRLNQVLINLLSNAIKYTQEGGSIQLSLYQEQAPEEMGEGYIRNHITVKDNGIGMTPEFVEHIFESYSRADSKRVNKTEGAGLGMAITKHIVNAMDGTITVESEPKKGTSFEVTVDFERADTEEIEMVLPPWKMLVVDDDEALCRTAVEALDSIGIQSDWCMSGEKALEMVTKHHRMRDDYQIVLLDWKLPGMDGIMVARQIRQIVDRDMPIILISAYDWNELEVEAREAGIDGFISKPLFKSTLYHSLKKYMNMEDIQEKASEELVGRRILVAEDNDLNWEILKELLTDIGMELEWAENGKICLEKFRESKEGHFDAILMDVRMPVMTGYEATEAIRALDHPDAKKIPIVAMTADAFSEDIRRCLDSGMNAHTAKPINLDEVVLLLKKFIL